jgi:hypothetical protein
MAKATVGGILVPIDTLFFSGNKEKDTSQLFILIFQVTHFSIEEKYLIASEIAPSLFSTYLANDQKGVILT